MSNNYLKSSSSMKYYLILAFVVWGSFAAKAQTKFRTDEPIIDQLKNGTAPGLLFNKSVPARKESAREPVRTGTSGRQIRSNSVPGVLYQTTEKAKTNEQPKPNETGDKAIEGPKPDEKAASPKGTP